MRSCFYIKTTKQHRKIFVQNIYILVFTEPSLTIVQNWRQLQWPPVGERTSELWHGHPGDATGHRRGGSSGRISRAGDSRGCEAEKRSRASPRQRALYDSIYVTFESQLRWSTVRYVRTVIASGRWNRRPPSDKLGMLFKGIGCGLHR